MDLSFDQTWRFALVSVGMQMCDKARVQMQARRKHRQIALFGGAFWVNRQKRGGVDFGGLGLGAGKGCDLVEI